VAATDGITHAGEGDSHAPVSADAHPSRLTLTHTQQLSDHWDRYGAGAVGVGGRGSRALPGWRSWLAPTPGTAGIISPTSNGCWNGRVGERRIPNRRFRGI